MKKLINPQTGPKTEEGKKPQVKTPKKQLFLRKAISLTKTSPQSRRSLRP
jgi:hypothetical protein